MQIWLINFFADFAKLPWLIDPSSVAQLPEASWNHRKPFEFISWSIACSVAAPVRESRFVSIFRLWNRQNGLKIGVDFDTETAFGSIGFWSVWELDFWGNLVANFLGFEDWNRRRTDAKRSGGVWESLGKIDLFQICDAIFQEVAKSLVGKMQSAWKKERFLIFFCCVLILNKKIHGKFSKKLFSFFKFN